jgi:hypothetical protein
MPYNRNIYNINWVKFVTELTPIRWRMVKHLVWLRAMAATWGDLYIRFRIYRASIKYQLLITPQVCFLEKALNDRYDTVLRRIFIEDAPEYLPMVLFRKIEGKKVVLHRKVEALHQVLYVKAETAQFSVDFIELRAFVDGYKLVTKTYKVKIF